MFAVYLRIISVAVSLCLSAQAAAADEVCDLTLTACPKQLPAGPILVPMDVISLDARIPYCQETGTIVNSLSASILFVIDNSGSMATADPTQARFSVVTSLLDSIYKTHPSTRVGLSIFTNRLAFDTRDRGLFRPAFPGDSTQHDAYVPLTRLDTLFGDGYPRGLDTLKALLSHNNGRLVHNTTRPGERLGQGGVVNPGGGTDITLGFDAALEAMKASPSPKEAQFIIFLSDGMPSGVDAIRQARMYAFEQGTRTPATFTVYFTPGGNPTVPPRIQTMTANIQANGYSTANPRSAAFAINLPGDQLQALLQGSVLNQILTVPTTGKGVTVTVDGKSQTTDRKADSAHFLFASRMALQADLTTLQFKYAHSFADTTTDPPSTRDTIFTYTLSVQRSPSAGPLPAILTKTCREQAALTLAAGGQVISVVNSGHPDLEARLQPPLGQACAGCTVQISLTGSADRESRILAPTGSSWNASFGRLESLTPQVEDGFLQHLANDSIVITWVNPENPLDVVRRSWPYQPLPSLLALYVDGVPIEAVTAHMTDLEVRLTRPAGAPCNPCQVLIAPSGGADRETRVLHVAGGSHSGGFQRIENVTPLPGDGILQHVAGDSIILVWVNPNNPADQVRRSYPYLAVAPALAVFANGKQVDTLTSAHARLEIRLTLPGGEPCLGCEVVVTLSGSADREKVSMGGSASPYTGAVFRETSAGPAAGNGTIEHLPGDSLIFTYVNPLNPAQRVRRSYPFVHFSNIVGITPQNSVANTSSLPVPDGHPWIISDAPGLVVQALPGSGPCCRVLAAPVNAQSPDSLRTVGIVLEASREFTLDVKVFSTLGDFVNRVGFTVNRAEFPKLTAVAGKDARSLRLLWNGRTLAGVPVGTGAYVLKTTLTLLPLPGITAAAPVVSKLHRVGVMR